MAARRCRTLRLAWAAIEEQPELGEKWDVDLPAMVQAMRAWRPAQLWAVREVLERVWTGTEAGLTPTEAIERATRPDCASSD